MAGMTAVEMVITELNRSGEGHLNDTLNVFRFTSAEHSSAQGDLGLHLKVTTGRHEIPGSNEVVEHVMAAAWQPFEIEGEWDDKWGNRRIPTLSGLTRTGSFAFSMYRAFAEMVARGPFIRLELDALSFVGILTDLHITYRTQTKISWKVTMSPHVNNNVAKRFEHPQPESRSIPRWAQDTKDQLLAIKTLNDTAKDLPMKTPRLLQSEENFAEISEGIDRLTQLLVDNVIASAGDQLLLFATTFRRIKTASISNAVSLVSISSANDIAFDGILQSATFAAWIATSIAASWKMVGICRAAELDMRQRAGKKPRSIYFPMAGESLEKISARFYGTAAAWRTIYDANNLSSLVLDGTEELLIPERRA